MMSSAADEMTIGELAAIFGLAPHVLRHWETKGLLTPARKINGRRHYGRQHVIRIAIIMLGKETGFSLEQLRDMFADARDRPARQEQYRHHHAMLAQRVARANASMAVLEHAMECDAEDFTQCPAFLRKVDAYLPPAWAEAAIA